MATSTQNHSFKLFAPPTWMNSGTSARIWLSYWPLPEPAIHTLKLTTVKIHEYGIQFESDQALPFGTTLYLRLLLPPMTAIAVQGLVVHEESCLTQETKHLISVRLTTIRDSDRRRLVEYSSARRGSRSQHATRRASRKASTQSL
ncbi:MAG: hypothetical protein VST68_10765 [Nitrospirota bacterium]|nr:hypothetical protein [Nitrospirota bacterium]